MLVNEVAQWAIIVMLALIALGAARQAAAVARPSEDGIGGPQVGTRLPEVVIDAIRSAGPHPSEPATRVTVAFVTEGCRACQRLIATAPRTATDLVLFARTPSAGFLESLSEAGLATVADHEAKLWDALGITATPLVVRIDQKGEVLARGVTHDVSEFAA